MSSATKLTIGILLALTLSACNGGGGSSKPPSTPWPTQTPAETPVSTPTPEPSISPSPTPTPALEKVHLTAQRIVKSGETLSLRRALYTNTVKGPAFLMEPNTILDCNGGVVEESTAEADERGYSPETHENVFSIVQDLASNRRNGAATSNIIIRNCTFKGARKDFSSMHQTVSLGNCDTCDVTQNRLENTRAIGVQFGGSAQDGHFAKNVKITHNVFIGVASQNAAIVNAEGFLIAHNQFLAPGQIGGPGTTSVDGEVNNHEDRLLKGHIHHNLIDHRNSLISPTGNGIQIAVGDSDNIGEILIEDNTIIGGVVNPADNRLSNGIFLQGTSRPAKGITVRRNTIIRTGQACIRAEGHSLVIEENKCDSTGGGGIPGFIAWVSNSTITSNTFSCTNGPCDGSLVLRGTGNRVEGNPGWSIMNQ